MNPQLPTREDFLDWAKGMGSPDDCRRLQATANLVAALVHVIERLDELERRVGSIDQEQPPHRREVPA